MRAWIFSMHVFFCLYACFLLFPRRFSLSFLIFFLRFVRTLKIECRVFGNDVVKNTTFNIVGFCPCL